MTSVENNGRSRFVDDYATGPIARVSYEQSLHRRPPVSTAVKCTRIALIVVIGVVGAFYLYPRIYNLTATPYRLDRAVESANNYNPALDRIVEHETVTLAAFDALDKMNAALADVLATDTAVSNELTTLIGQISNDVQFTLDSAGANVTELINSLDALTTQVEALQPPVGDAAAALTVDRTTLDSILVDAKNTAALVHSARVSAQESADDLSGK